MKLESAAGWVCGVAFAISVALSIGWSVDVRRLRRELTPDPKLAEKTQQLQQSIDRQNVTRDQLRAEIGQLRNELLRLQQMKVEAEKEPEPHGPANSTNYIIIRIEK